MDKIEYRAVIKYLFLKGNTPTQIKDELYSVYGDSAPSFTTVKFWAAEFKRCRKSLKDDERSGRSNTATADENIAKVHQIVLEDHRIKEDSDSVEDNECSGRPQTSRTAENVDDVSAAVRKNRLQTIEQIAESVGISEATCH
ncbi:HTH_48 domain-containing protein [Trichonephila clavipes]|nr:HTH_48 domain-containing protein [Trichonephila clavipes]